MTTDVSAARIKISGNGANSRNTVNLSTRRNVTVNQTSSSTNVNTVNVIQNSGGNKVSGNTGGSTVSIKTGSNSSFVSIVNSGSVNISNASLCCDDGSECPEEPVCENVPMNVSATIESDQGTLKTGDPITDATRTNPDNALGAADGQFFSLGKEGSVVYTFSQPAVNVPGDDLKFYEITNSRDTYPLEQALVEVSNDGSTWHTVGTVTSQDNGTGVTSLDFDSTGLDLVTHLRLTDTTDFSLHNNEADGYDIDAIEAFYKDCTESSAQL